MILYFFGAWGGPGHYLWYPTGTWASRQLEWSQKLDGVFAPDDPQQTPYRARLARSDGWTIVAFWDRSEDQRMGSNSAFVAKGEHTFEAVMEQARLQFAPLFQRFPTEITLLP